MNTYRQPFRNEWPITQKYGETITSPFHTGIDYGCPDQTEILASSDGTVMYEERDTNGYGKYVIIQHNSEASTLYAHLFKILVNVGEKVTQGQVIGLSGNTGNSTGPHLHFEARKVWNDFRSHFDPMKLPMKSVDDSIHESKPDNNLTVPEKGIVRVIAPYGAWGHNEDFNWKRIFQRGQELPFTGRTKEHLGLTFCECAVWIAANDGETQILEN